MYSPSYPILIQGDSGGPLVFRVRKSARNDTNIAVNTTESRVTVREGKTFLFDINDEIGDLLNTSDDYEDNYDYSNEVSNFHNIAKYFLDNQIILTFYKIFFRHVRCLKNYSTNQNAFG